MFVMTQHTMSLDKSQIQLLAKQYNTMDYSFGLRSLLQLVYPKKVISKLTKPELHLLFNHLLVNHYAGEAALKYQLFKRASAKKVVAAFEIPINNSRADFLTINGETTSYEIKSGLDNLDKLRKQSEDYLRAFEFNYVVIDNKHLANAKKILPTSFGIISFINGRQKTHHPATLNRKMDPRIQLEQMTKKEFTTAFKDCASRDQVLLKYKDRQVNDAFKNTLKIRYAKRWNFLLANRQHILPVDLQFFFNSNISPELIYTMG